MAKRKHTQIVHLHHGFISSFTRKNQYTDYSTSRCPALDFLSIISANHCESSEDHSKHGARNAKALVGDRVLVIICNGIF